MITILNRTHSQMASGRGGGRGVRCPWEADVGPRPWEQGVEEDDFDGFLVNDSDDSDIEEAPAVSPGNILVEYVMSLWTQRTLTDKQCCTMMFHAWRAGVEEARMFSLPPTSGNGHHGRKLREKLRWTMSNKDSPLSSLIYVLL